MAAPDNSPLIEANQQIVPAASSLPAQNQKQPAFVGFQMPRLSLVPTNSSRQYWPRQKQQMPMEEPQFVVFEVANSSRGGQQQKAAKDLKELRGPAPFLPLGHSSAANLQKNPEEQEDDCQQQQQVHFTVVQLGTTPQQNRMPMISGPSRPNGRLLFDNPMFRRLPNWHFFGDDHRLAQIPPVIPILRIPVERTLLSIVPSLSWTRQFLLLGLLDLRGGGQAALDYEPLEYSEKGEEQCKIESDQEDEEEEEGSLPNCSSYSEAEELQLPDGGGCPSSSGFESMCSSETTMTTPTNGGSTPLRAITPDLVEKEAVKPEMGGQQQQGSSDALLQPTDFSSCNSVSSSSPNSPPTFDRRTVRMTRATRNAVLELSISKRFCEIEDDEQLVSTTDDHMATRIRHVSNSSTKSNAGTGVSKNSAKSTGQNKHSKPPFTLDGISRMDVLSESIYNFHQNIEQGHYEMNRKLMLRDQLYYAITPIFPMCGLYIVGSSLNGFGTSRSDLDLCLMITPRDIDQRSDAIVILSAVMAALKHNKLLVEHQLIAAKVPILRIKCEEGVFSDIMVDLNVNNAVAIRNTHLLCYYSAFDWRVRPIVMVVKEWAKRRGINNASRSTFTSYSLVLMVIHYLQCGASPPVLPSLQQLYPQRFADNIDIRRLNVSQPLEPQPSELWNFDQRLSLSELLLGFLKYFAFDFDFDKDAISIRMGRKLDRSQVTHNQSPFNSLTQWHCICIEEPFTRSNAAHSVYDERIFQEIKKTFADSYLELEKYRELDKFLGLTEKEEAGNGSEPAGEPVQLEMQNSDVNEDVKMNDTPA